MKFDNVGIDPNIVFEGHKGWAWITTDRATWPIIARDWELYHKYKILPLVKNKRVVVQAGGNCGMYPRLLSSIFDRVYTAEPDPANFQCLTINCDTDNVIKLNCAFGNKNELVRMNHRTMANVGMHMVEQGEGSYIPTLKIDQLALDCCDLLWLDVEEYEEQALKGAKQTIKKYSPVIAIENYQESHGKFLDQFGYTIVDKSAMDTILIKTEPR